MKHCYGFTYLSDRAKLREINNDNNMMIKFESYLAVNNNNNKNNTAITENWTTDL